MLAAKADLETLTYPMLLSPKFDGVRCLIIDGVACGRSLKPIPNKFVQLLFGHSVFNGFDGELIVDSPVAKDVFQRTQSGVMSIEGEPAVKFYVFDDFLHPGGFSQRFGSVHKRTLDKAVVEHVFHQWVYNVEQVLYHEGLCLGQGYEGVMLRGPSGLYKHGRSTAREGGLLKLKRFEDGEAMVVGYTQLMTNTNKAKRNALGHLERSSHKSGMVGAGTLGSLIVKDLKTKVEFDIGTGFTAEQRATLWQDHENLLGKVAKYKFQPVGVKDKPRFPVFLGFRSKVDL
jgi:DNA ligase 1